MHKDDVICNADRMNKGGQIAGESQLLRRSRIVSSTHAQLPELVSRHANSEKTRTECRACARPLRLRM